MKLIHANLLVVNVTQSIHTLSYNMKINTNKYSYNHFNHVFDSIYNNVFNEIISIRSFLYDSV